jgi:DNA-binding transcriptional ArsR family regulator
MSFDRRELGDVQDIRALSHPMRLRLLDLLIDGPLTATEAAAALGTTPANCSFHLRLLARHGFITEAEGGTGRQRPWQVVERFLTAPPEPDESTRQAMRDLAPLVDLWHVARLAQWRRTSAEFPADWQRAARTTYAVVDLTAAELAKVVDAMHEVLLPYLQRTRAELPPGAVPTDVHLTAMPRRQAKEGT